MNRGVGSWLLGSASSIALHGAGAVVALALVAPEDMPEQPTPGAQFELETTALERSRAEEQAAEGEAAEDIEPEGRVAQGQGIVRREARASSPEAAAAATVSEDAPAAAAVVPEGNTAPAAVPETPLTQGQSPEAPRAEAQSAPAETAAAVSAESALATPAEPEISSATAQDLQSASVEQAEASAPRLDAAGLPTESIQADTRPAETQVAAAEAPAPRVSAASVDTGAVQVAAPPEERRASAAEAPTARIAAAGIDAGTVQVAFQPEERRASAAEAPTARVAAAGIETGVVQAAFQPPERPASAAPPPTTNAPSERPDGVAALSAPAEGASAPSAPAEGETAATAPTDGTPAAIAEAPATQATAAAVEGPVIGAQFAYAGEGALDPQGLAAVQAFLPEDARSKAGEEVRDDISSLMTSVPCARVHTAFNPDTGALELRGHVPTDSTRPELVSALQARVGDTLPVQDAMRILPEPQCDVLTGIEALGLPPSEEQFTDPALVGETGWAQDYAFTDGDRLTLDLQGPDYPAHVYLDYFDGGGNVVHIVPNEIVSLPSLGIAEPFSVGRDDGLDLRISPPFGQDIVVAMATDVPIYEGLRPTVEQAAPYLEFLRERLDALGDVRGEWAYFFVTTAAR